MSYYRQSFRVYGGINCRPVANYVSSRVLTASQSQTTATIGQENSKEAYRDKNEQQPEQQSTSTNPYVFGDDYVSDHVVVIFDKMSFIPELQLQPEQEQQMMQRFEFHAGTTYRNNPVFVYDPTKIQVQLWGGRNRNKHTRRQKKRRQHSYMLCSICRRRTARRMK